MQQRMHQCFKKPVILFYKQTKYTNSLLISPVRPPRLIENFTSDVVDCNFFLF